MTLLVAALTLGSVAVLLGVLAARRHTRFLKLSALILGGLSALVFGFLGWAFLSTDSSQLARAILWEESSFDDYLAFPERTFQSADQPMPLEGPETNIGLPAVNGQDLETLLTDTESTAFLVIRDGELVYERYFNGSSRTSTQTSFSVAKSWTSTLVGIAVDQGLIESLDDPITKHLPELEANDPRFTELTLRHLMTMTSGLAFEAGTGPWDDPANTYYGTDLRTSALTETALSDDPGQTFLYNDWNLILMGMALERATGLSVSRFMEESLWQPMGAESTGSWSLDSEAGGFEKMFVGVNASAVDFAKLGLLYLNGGRLNGSQLVSSDYIASAVSEESTTGQYGYGYWWWIDPGSDTYFALGDHCQLVHVNPAADLVLVRHGRSCADIDWPQLLVQVSAALAESS